MTPPASLSRRLTLLTLMAGTIPALAAAIAIVLAMGSLHGFTLANPLVLPSIAIVLCVVALGGGLLCIVLVRRVVKTLRALHAQAEAMAGGDLTKRVSNPNRKLGEGCLDELDQVTDALNLLAAQLSQQIVERDRSEIQLRSLNADLERRIDARTRELEDAQHQIVRVEKRVALGQLVAGIAHEINNHVNFITSATRPVEMGIHDLTSAIDSWHSVIGASTEEFEDRIREAQQTESDLEIGVVRDELAVSIKQMREGAQRIRTIVTNLRTFSHRGNDEQGTANLKDLVERTLMLVRPTISEDIEFRINLEGPMHVACLPVQMSQVLINLVVNAAGAVDSSGVITIQSWREHDEICLSVQDNGCGIPTENLHKIFDPFYTTKDVGEGTGLGLYVCHQILEEHGGGIHVESIVGEGTEVTLHWPLAINEPVDVGVG